MNDKKKGEEAFNNLADSMTSGSTDNFFDALMGAMKHSKEINEHIEEQQTKEDKKKEQKG